MMKKQLRNISKKYEDMLGNYQLVITNVHEQYLYNHTFLIKLVGFLSSLCTIVLLLNIMIIVTVSRLEFRENAMKISLMKIFGYSLFERHKTLLKNDCSGKFCDISRYAYLFFIIGTD